MRSILLAGTAALALSLPAAAQMSPGTASGAQVTRPAMGGADAGRSGGVSRGSDNQATSGSGAGNMGTNPGAVGGSATGFTPRATPRDHRHSAARPSAAGRAAADRNNDREPPATAEQIRREEARQTGARAARPTRPEDRAFMGGGMVLEDGRPVALGDGAATNAMGGARGAVQPGTGGPVGTGRNAGVTPGGGN